MSEIEYVDRYGGNPPDPKTVCHGQCEGTGGVPILGEIPDGTDRASASNAFPAVETEEPWLSLWKEAHAKPHEKPCDGWHFVKCPTCDGTGKRPPSDSTQPAGL